MTETQASILKALATRERVLLMGHRDPDGDSAGSLLALAEVLKGRNVYCYSQGRLPTRYEFLDPERCLKGVVDPDFRPDLAIAFEAPTMDRLADGVQMISGETQLINIDHHRDNTSYGHLNWVDVRAAALGEMIYELLIAGDYTITPHAATCLYTAILTDTGRFQYPATSASTLGICSELVKLGADPTAITRRVYFGLPFSYLRLMQAALDGMQQVADGQILALTLTPAHFESAGARPEDAEGIIDLTQMSKGVKIGILFRQEGKGAVKVSFRSQNAVDVGALAAGLNGGGHKNASGCIVEGDLPGVRAFVLEKAIGLLGAGV